ncbi:MAG: hypothetical protein SGJ13_07585 [Actinomycetota bacterium]|nr:hypothetical protein [Actinomycetota bacterium]
MIASGCSHDDDTEPAAEPAVAVRVGPCPADGDARWLAFAGGYWVAVPACVTVEVSASSDPVDARVPVGAACA